MGTGVTSPIQSPENRIVFEYVFVFGKFCGQVNRSLVQIS
jgi:hypothetical protein